jgi:hypothetical protein
MLGMMRRRAVFTVLLAMSVAACAPAPLPTPAVPVPAPPTATSPAAASPGAAPSAPQHASRTWVGDAITVAEAIDHRDHHLDDTELAVEGYAWTPAGPIFCPLILPVPGPALAGYEPRAKGVDALTSSHAVWLIRYLARTDSRPVLKTVLVADRSDLLAGNVFTVSASGEISFRSVVGEPIPSP